MGPRLGKWVCFGLAFLPVAGTWAHASGWNDEGRGAKAAALAGAFVAQADDPSAVSYNPAGLAFLEDRSFAAGFAVTAASHTRYAAVDPISGSSTPGGLRVEPEPHPHVYWVEPVAARWAVGVALHGGEGFAFDWKQGDRFPGRFESRDSRLTSWDLSSVAAVRVHPALGVSAGVVVRSTTLAWDRHESGLNPATMLEEEIGRSHLRPEPALGAAAVLGLLYRPGGRWSLGLRWRDSIVTSLKGQASFVQLSTGDPVFDGLAAALLPFGERVEWSARLRHPRRLSVGAAYALGPTALLELDIEHTSWDSLNGTVIVFSGRPDLDRLPFAGWRSRVATRIGLRWNGLGNGEWRTGIHHDPTPQPVTDLGPFFVGADRYGAAIGFGTRVHRLQTDLALVWEEFEDRATRAAGFEERYSTRLVQLVLTCGW